jgi:hypothetical protein
MYIGVIKATLSPEVYCRVGPFSPSPKILSSLFYFFEDFFSNLGFFADFLNISLYVFHEERSSEAAIGGARGARRAVSCEKETKKTVERSARTRSAAKTY